MRSAASFSRWLTYINIFGGAENMNCSKITPENLLLWAKMSLKNFGKVVFKFSPKSKWLEIKIGYLAVIWNGTNIFWLEMVVFNIHMVSK